LDGGYSGLSAAHSDVHLWYHGTVDLATPATDSQAIITESERDAWFSAAESRGAQTGFIYSRLAGGNRFSASRPAGSGQGAIHDGINRRWDLGAGLANNRRTLALNEGQWANVVRLDFTATNPAPLNLPIPLIFYYQHEQPPAVTANVAFLLDVDGNPFNGNETQLAGQALEGTGVAGVRSIHRTLAIPASVVPGVYRLFALTDYGGRVRYQPADRLLTLSSPVVTPHLAALTREDGATILEVSGAPEQTLILETTTDFDVWTPLATNTLESEVWIFMDDTVSATGYKFYRAQVVGTDFAD
jgi:hypothetical protein